MPRMMPLNIRTPDIGNVLTKTQNLRTGRLQENTLRRQLEREPELHEMTMKRGRQTLRQGEQQIRTGNVKYTLEKLDTLAKLLRGVYDEQSYQRAIDDYIRMFPDEAGGLKTVKPPKEYSQDWVDAMVQVAESASERAAAMGLAGQQIAAGSRERVAAMGLEGKKIIAGTQRDVAQMKLEGIEKREPRLEKREERLSKMKKLKGARTTALPLELREDIGKEGLRPLPGKDFKLKVGKKGKTYTKTAVNPETGERIGWDEDLKKWVIIK